MIPALRSSFLPDGRELIFLSDNKVHMTLKLLAGINLCRQGVDIYMTGFQPAVSGELPDADSNFRIKDGEVHPSPRIAINFAA